MEPSRDRPDEFDVLIQVPSPTGDPQRTLVIWMDDGEPSLGFGSWHTHASLLGDREGAGCERIIDTAAAILADQFVLCYDVGGADDAYCGVLDLRDEEALAGEITSKYSPGKVDLRSRGGSADRRVGLGDVKW